LKENTLHLQYEQVYSESNKLHLEHFALKETFLHFGNEQCSRNIHNNRKII